MSKFDDACLARLKKSNKVETLKIRINSYKDQSSALFDIIQYWTLKEDERFNKLTEHEGVIGCFYA